MEPKKTYAQNQRLKERMRVIRENSIAASLERISQTLNLIYEKWKQENKLDH